MRVVFAIKSLIIATLVFLPLGSVLAAEETATPPSPMYQIEVLVFLHCDPKALNSELWSLANASQKSAFFNDSSAPQMTIDHDSTSSLRHTSRLKKIESTLAEQSDYDVLLRYSWVQAITEKTKKIEILMPGQESGNDKDAVAKNWALHGFLTLNRSRYFNVHTKMQLKLSPQTLITLIDRMNGNDLDPQMRAYLNRLYTAHQLLEFNVDEKRRTRSDEIHYFDHPVFGMLLVIHKVE